MMGIIILIMKKPSFYPALDKKPEPQSIEEAEEAIRLLHETISSLTERKRPADTPILLSA